MKHVTAKELQEIAPKRFDKEYYAWLEHVGGYAWWDYLDDAFKARMEGLGVTVSDIQFTSFPWSATFEGRVDVASAMRHLLIDEKYPALYLAVDADGSYVRVNDGRYGNTFSLCDSLGSSEPSGIFKHLDSEAWDELVEEQLEASNLENAIESMCNSECEQLARDLEDAYDAMTSVEEFIESCSINDETFEVEEEEDEVHA